MRNASNETFNYTLTHYEQAVPYYYLSDGKLKSAGAQVMNHGLVRSEDFSVMATVARNWQTAVAVEPELPGPAPDVVWELVQNAVRDNDRVAISVLCQEIVKSTKRGIKQNAERMNDEYMAAIMEARKTMRIWA